MLNKADIDLFSFTNLRQLRNKAVGILVELHALDNEDTLIELMRKGKEWAKKDILFVYPYTSPWNWMNGETVGFIDELMDILLSSEHCFADIPVVVYGYSMGGHGALVYPAFSRHRVSASAAVCPICDVPYHYKENAYVPRTMISAFFCEPDLNIAIAGRSPLHIIDKMPKMPYLILHCKEDERVNIVMHSDKLVQKMKSDGFDITYHIVEKSGHCTLDDGSKALLDAFLSRQLGSS